MFRSAAGTADTATTAVYNPEAVKLKPRSVMKKAGPHVRTVQNPYCEQNIAALINIKFLFPKISDHGTLAFPFGLTSLSETKNKAATSIVGSAKTRNGILQLFKKTQSGPATANPIANPTAAPELIIAELNPLMF